MTIALQMSFRHMAASPALEFRARQFALALERVCPDIVRCHVFVEPPARQAPDGVYRIRLQITVPRRDTLAGRTHVLHQSHADAFVALQGAFFSARRQLDELERSTTRAARGRQGQTFRVLY